MFVTLDDVARVAGVSPATVSRALNGSELVGEGVREKVRAAVKRTGYTPRRRRNGAGKADGNGDGNGMAVINVVLYRTGSYEDLQPMPRGVRVGAPHEYHAADLKSPQFRRSDNFLQGMLEGVLDACSYFRVKAGVISADDLRDPKLLEEVRGTGHAGMVFGGMRPEGLDDFLAQCRQPVVLMDIVRKGGPMMVTSDNMDGVRQAVAHLAGLGHRDIGFVGTLDGASYGERHSGFLMAMAEAGLAVRPGFVVDSPGGVAETARRLAPMLARKARPTALVASSDYFAIAAMEAARGLGLRVPRDLSVTGFDDVAVAQRVTPALTTVRVPVRELGWLAVAQLLSLPRAGRKTDGVIVRVPVELVVRGTCAPPLKGKTFFTTKTKGAIP